MISNWLPIKKIISNVYADGFQETERCRIGQLGFEELNEDELVMLHFQLTYGDKFQEEAECHYGAPLSEQDVVLLRRWVDHVFYANEDQIGHREFYTA